MKYSIRMTETASTAVVLAYVGFFLAAAVGWVMNIITLCSNLHVWRISDVELWVRIIGVPVGIIGAVMGWF